MKDRVPLYPGRVTLTPVPGQANTYDMVRADQPTQEGTPLNKANLLADAVAAKLGLTGDPTPNDALDALADQKASKQQAAADAGKYWKIGTDGSLEFGTPVAKFSQGPLLITTSQTLDLSQRGSKRLLRRFCIYHHRAGEGLYHARRGKSTPASARICRHRDLMQ